MNKFFRYIMAAAAISFAATACDDDNEYMKGAEEDPDCFGVYFPAQDVSNIVLDPAEEQAFTLTVSRNNSDGNIVVPVEVVDEEGIFSIPEIAFEDGQSSTDVKISFNAEIGKKYSGSIRITDGKYASIYNSEAVAIDFAVTREKWNVVGWGTWFENGDNGYFGFSTPEPVLIEQNDNTPAIFRVQLRYDENNIPEERGENFGWYVYSAESDQYFEFKVLKPGDVVYKGLEGYETKVTEEDLVFYNDFNSGCENSNYPGTPINFCFPGGFKSLNDQSNWLHNRVLQYQENGLPAGVAIAPYYYMDGVGGWNMTQNDDVITILFPGAVLTDYSLAISAGFAEEGEIPVNFSFGADVAKAKYAAYEGELNAVQIAARAQAIAEGSEESAEEITEGGVVNFSFEATGVYTVVAVSYDDAGNVQQTASVSFGYVAADDTVPVVVNCGLAVTSKYEPKGYSSDNSLEFYVNGKELVDVKIGVFNHASFASDPDACLEAVKESESLDADALAAINADGYVDLFTKLTPGTQFHMVVVASNGYEQKAITATATTTGDPLPVYMNYTMADYASDYGFATENDIVGKSWNLYAVDLYGDLGMREFIGEAEFTDSDTEDEYVVDDPDYGTYTDYYMYVSGFAGPLAKEFGMDDRIEALLEDGLLVLPTAANTVDEKTEVPGITAEGKAYGVYNTLFGIPVADGYYAFISNPGYTQQGVEMAGLGFVDDEGWYCKYIDYLLVDPEKDDNGLAPAQAAANLHRVKDAFKIAGSGVLTPENRIRSIREALKKVNPVNFAGHKAGVKGSIETRSVAFTATPAVKVSKNDAPVKAELLKK